MYQVALIHYARYFSFSSCILFKYFNNALEKNLSMVELSASYINQIPIKWTDVSRRSVINVMNTFKALKVAQIENKTGSKPDTWPKTDEIFSRAGHKRSHLECKNSDSTVSVWNKSLVSALCLMTEGAFQRIPPRHGRGKKREKERGRGNL